MSDSIVVRFGEPGTAVETFQANQVGVRPFEDVTAALKREIVGAGMKVLHEIDPQKALQSGGHAIGGSRLIFFFHPSLVVRLLRTDWTAIVEAPLKLAVMELPDGRVAVRWTDPAAAFARYGNPALANFGQELSAACKRIVAASI
jgi:uncharacterized protein (DUF302 family)